MILGMRTFPTALSAVLLTASVCQARIGETKSECAERYGEPITTSPAQLTKSDGAADVFEAGTFKITIEYRKGKAWMVAYQGRSMNKSDVEGLLAKNSEDATWKHAKFLGAEHWIAKDKGMHAVHFLYPSKRLVVMTKASLEVPRNPREKLAEESKGNDGSGKGAPIIAPDTVADKKDRLRGL
jgi:hypothetical protein